MLVMLLLYLSKQPVIAGGVVAFSGWCRRFYVHVFCHLCCCIISLLCCIALKGQEIKLIYNIIKGGSVIGKAVATKSIEGANVKYKMSTDSKTSFIVSIEVSTREESIFSNGMLIKSAFCQKTNGKEKVNTNVKWDGSGYQFINNGEAATVKGKKILANMMMLFFSLPDPALKVFTDHYQSFIAIEKLGADEYKTVLPNGTEKHFFYKNGVCHQLDIKSTFYNITMQLVP